ncbi:hypothetical protein [Hymenobacter sp. B1770]|uniref:hypothetical protein n=1 Tax=Hymenobacter sp. B1770 TaxID=1718788 RepID=UPI003CF01A8B
MNLRLLFLLPALLFYSFETLAQAYEPSLLVRSNGDTLRGEIENGFWQEPPKFIRYRATPDSVSQLFRARQLRVVSFTGGRKFSYEALPIDRAAETRFERLPRGLYPNIHVDSILAEVLVEGPATLLRVAKFSTTHYLVRRPDQPFLDLCERQYLRPGQNGKFIITDGNNYKAQLELYFGDCPAVGKAVQAAPFTAGALVGILQEYNQNCAPIPQPGSVLVAQATPRRKRAFLYGLLLGGRYQSFAGEKPSGQWQPHGGAYGELLLPNRTVAVYGELGINSSSGQGSTVAYYNRTVTSVNGIDRYSYSPVYSSFDSHAWVSSARLGLRYFFTSPGEERCFFGFGLETNIPVRSTFTTTAGPPARPNYFEKTSHVPPIVPLIGLGWRRQHLTGTIDGVYFTSALYAFRLGLAYRLNSHPDLDRIPTKP